MHYSVKSLPLSGFHRVHVSWMTQPFLPVPVQECGGWITKLLPCSLTDISFPFPSHHCRDKQGVDTYLAVGLTSLPLVLVEGQGCGVCTLSPTTLWGLSFLRSRTFWLLHSPGEVPTQVAALSLGCSQKPMVHGGSHTLAERQGPAQPYLRPYAGKTGLRHWATTQLPE